MCAGRARDVPSTERRLLIEVARPSCRCLSVPPSELQGPGCAGRCAGTDAGRRDDGDCPSRGSCVMTPGGAAGRHVGRVGRSRCVLRHEGNFPGTGSRGRVQGQGSGGGDGPDLETGEGACAEWGRGGRGGGGGQETRGPLQRGQSARLRGPSFLGGRRDFRSWTEVVALCCLTLKIVGIFSVLCILSDFGLCIMDVFNAVL